MFEIDKRGDNSKKDEDPKKKEDATPENNNKKEEKEEDVKKEKFSISDIYFAVKEPKIITKIEVYKVSKKETVANVRKKYQNKALKNTTVECSDNKTLKKLMDVHELNIGDVVKVQWRQIVKDEFVYKKINKLVFNREIFVVAICNADKGKLKIEIKEKENRVYGGNSVKFLVDGSEKSDFTFEFNSVDKWSKEYNQEIKLCPKEKTDLCKLIKKYTEHFDNEFNTKKDKTKHATYLYIKPTVTEDGNIITVPEKKIKERYHEISLAIDDKFRTHFVLHSTAIELPYKGKVPNPYKPGKMIDGIEDRLNRKPRERWFGHCFLMRDGKYYFIHDFKEQNVTATKFEKRYTELQGRMFHVEVNYEEAPRRNQFADIEVLKTLNNGKYLPTEAQYEKLAELYMKAHDALIDKGFDDADSWPLIVPHIEIDRGINDGHRDPTDFDFKYFYNKLLGKVPTWRRAQFFNHDRYWEEKLYKEPLPHFERSSWPPVLSGAPQPQIPEKSLPWNYPTIPEARERKKRLEKKK